jgi:small-conductance mechanosensitive channel
MEGVDNLLAQTSELLDTTLIETGSAVLNLGQVLFALSALIGGFIVVRIIERVVAGRLRRTSMGPDMLQLVRRVLFYGLMAMVLLTALAILGIPLTAFAFVSGAIAIGVGFGAQNIINNFISGWILMGERPIRIGDYIELGEVRGRVEAINNRSTRIRRTDGVHLLVPNSALLETTVTNWTLMDDLARSSVQVGVAYGSPVRKVQELMLDICHEHPEVLRDPEPEVFFQDFGDSALVFEAYFWLRASSEGGRRRVRSDIRFAIDAAFAEHGIAIAYPQRDLHVDGSLVLKGP